MRRALLLTIALLPACSMCGRGPTDPPARFVGKDAQMLIEIPDLAFLVKRRPALAARLEGIATKEQIDLAAAELTRQLTFDPTTKEGLAASGLADEGTIAIEAIDQGRAALIIAPVKDAKKASATIQEIVKSRETVVETKTEKVEGAELVHQYGEFGPEKILLGAHAIQHGYAFFGIGKGSLEGLKAALTRKKEDSLLVHPEYAPLVAAVGDTVARVIVPSAGAFNAMLGASLGLPQESLALQVKSLGWGLSMDERSVAVLLKMRFNEAAQPQIKKVLTPHGKLPAGVAAIQAEDAVITILAAGDVDATLEALFPAGSELRSAFDSVVAGMKTELDVDLEGQVIKQMSGHVGISLGITDPKLLADVRELLTNPARALWSAGAVGLKDGDAVKGLNVLSGKQDPSLEKRGLARSARKVGANDVSVLSMSSAPAGVDAMLMETWVGAGAWSFSNAAARTDKLVAAEAKPPADKLGGAGGLIVEVRAAPIASALRAVDLQQLGGAEAMLISGFVAKGLTVLDRLERAEVRAAPMEQGVAAELRVVFAPTK